MSTRTDEDLTILESLDFEPSCEHSGHEKNGYGSAEWIVLVSPVLSCGCASPASIVLWCEGCRSHILSLVRVDCPGSLHLITPAENIVHVMALR